MLKNIYVILAKGAGAVVSLLMTWAISFYLGAESAGVFFLSFTLVTVLSVFSRLGFDNIALREAAIVHATKDKKRIEVYYLLLLRVMLASVAFSMVILFFSSTIANLLFGSSQYSDMLSIMCLAIFPIAAYHLNAFAIQGSGRSVQFAVIINLLYPLCVLIFVLVYRDDMNLFSIALAVPIAALIVFVYSRLILYSSIPECGSGALFKRLNMDVIISARQFFVISLANLSTSWLMLLILGLLLTPRDVGIYNAVFRLSFTLSFFLISIVIVAAPKFAIMHSNKNMKQMEIYARKISRIVLVLSLLPIVLMLTIPDYILSVFGNEFVEGKAALQILAVGQLFNISVGPVQTIINMTKNEKHLKQITLETSIISLILAIITIPMLGIAGGALSYSAALLMQNVRSYQVVKKKLNIRVSPFSFE